MRQALRILIIPAVVMVLVGCQPTGVRPTATAQSSQPTQVATSVAAPANAQALKSMSADLDGDGKAEEVAVSQAGDELRVTIAAAGGASAWSTALTKGATLDSLTSRDVTGDRKPEVLVATHGPAKDTYELAIVSWAAGKGTVIAPHGGPLDGQPSFRSHYYAVAVDDLNEDNLPEVIVAADAPEPHFLDTVVYEWDGKQFIKSELYMMAPRLVPTAQP